LIPERASESAGSAAEAARRNGSIEQAVAAAELRVRAIRDGHNDGWVQLPKGTTVSILRRDGDLAVIRWDATVVKVAETALRLGALRSDGKPGWFQPENRSCSGMPAHADAQTLGVPSFLKSSPRPLRALA
jgi:hypothetical protein